MDDFIDLIQQAQGTDKTSADAAFNELVTRFQAMAYRRAYALLNDPYLAEEATQEAFITAYLRLGQLQQPQAFPAWLRRIIWTQADRLTRGQRPTFEPLEQRAHLASDSPDPEMRLEETELHYRVRRAIAALPEHERTVTESFYIAGESQKEIAARLSLPLTTVKKRLQYAREHLRALIDGFNAAVDQAFDDAFAPQQEPARQPAYVRSPRIEEDETPHE